MNVGTQVNVDLEPELLGARALGEEEAVREEEEVTRLPRDGVGREVVESAVPHEAAPTLKQRLRVGRTHLVHLL